MASFTASLSDISVDFIQQLLSNANAQLYGGVGEIALISTTAAWLPTAPTRA